MNDMYEIFGNLYEEHLESIGIYESGMIIFKETVDGIEHDSIVRVEYDGSDLIFEYDFYEGQPCTLIACFTDSEITTRLMRSIGD